MQIKRYLNDLPISSLQDTLLHDDIIENIISVIRERTEINAAK